MSLQFWLDKCNEPDELWLEDNSDLQPTTKAIVHLTMAVGMGEIREATAQEFFARVRLYENMAGATLHTKDGASLITPEDVQRHIGLKTNVANETRQTWVKRVIIGEVGMLNDLVKLYHNETRVSV